MGLLFRSEVRISDFQTRDLFTVASMRCVRTSMIHRHIIPYFIHQRWALQASVDRSHRAAMCGSGDALSPKTTKRAEARFDIHGIWFSDIHHSMMDATIPAPTVRPPS
ncbi:MAG: hypothetical protein Q8O63_05170, partial [Hoeflea sp.]|nr:hypothetical protein [Hoeflea sp.]